ncbi:hypothetical protein CXU22_05365 [Akkermansia muciniphila]|uniref:NlpC/P60 domain-containing protein n=1 Tax=Akkermansia muciniphila TaxID=239935 RepID=A0A2N8HDM3_9BACT|nr:hypothetical protein [Akkermansia muciniphila]PNC18068.1 hypothetical protein CXU22_05365 [Akkermansia muciniphila]
MQAMTNALMPLTLSVCLAACSPCVPEILPPASSVTRREALEISRAYTAMAWKGSSRNIRHGKDPDGIRIDTPDADAPGGHAGAWWRPGKCSTGMPYKWGGFDTPRQFAARLKADAASGGAPAAAGDMGTAEKQAAGDAAVSRFAAGVDCSGFVSRCWRLDRPFSTRELPALSVPIPWEELRTGDILIAPGRHVLLFIQWEGTEKGRFLGSEAGPLPVWKCGEHVFSRPSLEKNDYLPMRYKGMLPARGPSNACSGSKERPAIRR